MMEIAINELVAGGVPSKNILWLGFDDERLKSMDASQLDEVVVAYMEMYPDVAFKDVHIFLDEIQLIKRLGILCAAPLQILLQEYLCMRK